MSTIQHYLGNSVLKKAAGLKKLTYELNQILPTQFIGQCQVAEISKDQMIIAVSSPAWSSQLRYYLPAIQKKWRFQHIRILVSPEMAGVYQRPASKPARQLDSEAAQTIAASAEHIDDPKIKKALLRLAQQGDSQSKK